MAYVRKRKRLGVLAMTLIIIWLITLLAFLFKMFNRITNGALDSVVTAGSRVDKSINVAAAVFTPASFIMAGILMQSIPYVGTAIGWTFIITGVVIALYNLYDWNRSKTLGVDVSDNIN